MSSATRRALIEGLSDAAGFVLGALLGWLVGRALGFDAVTAGAWDQRSAIGLAFVLVGCGLGKWLSGRVKRWLIEHLLAGRQNPPTQR